MDSSADASPTPSNTRYWCHLCAQNITPEVGAMAQFSPDDAAELTCPLCHESFVEELEPEQPEPAAAPAPDPAVTQPPSAPQPTAPPVFQGGPFGFPFGFPFTMPMQAAPGMPPAQPHAMPFPFSFVPPAHAAATATAGGAAATQPGQPQEPTPFPFLRVPRNGTVVFTVGGGAPMGGGVPMGGGTIPAAVHVGTNPFAQLVQQIMQSLNAHEPIQNEQWEGGNLDALLNRLFEQTAFNMPPPADAQEVEKLHRFQWQGGEGDCAVCKDDFQTDDPIVQMPCKHNFHQDCLLPWLERSNTCPVCRCPLRTVDADYNQRLEQSRQQQQQQQQQQ